MNKIKDKREAAGLTQNRLAETLGVDRSTIAKWETGEALPRADKFPLLAKILKCKIDDLFVSDKSV
ncbi:MAG: helix-turn-helix transcriptional regulator [Clostridia bacterium]|nr:helix-turn-helix transcriptional regulator [Clostridia bacterium]